MDLSQVVRDLVNHFKAELDNLIRMAKKLVGERRDLGDTTVCLYLLSIGNSLIQLINDAVLFTGVLRKNISERVIARVLMIRADSELVRAYIDRGWVDPAQGQRAREALQVEEDRLGELYSQLSAVLNTQYTELVQYAMEKLDEFASLYKSVGCDVIMAV